MMLRCAPDAGQAGRRTTAKILRKCATFAALTNAIETYEGVRRPDGEAPGVGRIPLRAAPACAGLPVACSARRTPSPGITGQARTLSHTLGDGICVILSQS